MNKSTKTFASSRIPQPLLNAIIACEGGRTRLIRESNALLMTLKAYTVFFSNEEDIYFPIIALHDSLPRYLCRVERKLYFVFEHFDKSYSACKTSKKEIDTCLSMEFYSGGLIDDDGSIIRFEDQFPEVDMFSEWNEEHHHNSTCEGSDLPKDDDEDDEFDRIAAAVSSDLIPILRHKLNTMFSRKRENIDEFYSKPRALFSSSNACASSSNACASRSNARASSSSSNACSSRSKPRDLFSNSNAYDRALSHSSDNQVPLLFSSLSHNEDYKNLPEYKNSPLRDWLDRSIIEGNGNNDSFKSPERDNSEVRRLFSPDSNIKIGGGNSNKSPPSVRREGSKNRLSQYDNDDEDDNNPFRTPKKQNSKGVIRLFPELDLDDSVPVASDSVPVASDSVPVVSDSVVSDSVPVASVPNESLPIKKRRVIGFNNFYGSQPENYMNFLNREPEDQEMIRSLSEGLTQSSSSGNDHSSDSDFTESNVSASSSSSESSPGAGMNSDDDDVINQRSTMITGRKRTSTDRYNPNNNNYPKGSGPGGDHYDRKFDPDNRSNRR
jgi:hypothetical protein